MPNYHQVGDTVGQVDTELDSLHCLEGGIGSRAGRVSTDLVYLLRTRTYQSLSLCAIVELAVSI